jgi:putative transcriptional regulator
MTDETSDIPGHDGGEERFLGGQVLIAMPAMGDARFARSLVYVCAHSEDGAMGLIVNRPADGITLGDLYEKLSIPLPDRLAKEGVRFGGPVEPGRGFVLHSADYSSPDATLEVDREISMTATLEVLHAIAAGEGP